MNFCCINHSSLMITVASLFLFSQSTLCGDEHTETHQFPLRTWTDDSGRFSTRARLQWIPWMGGIVSLGKEDGTVVEVPIARLSTPDREYLHDLQPTCGLLPFVIAVGQGNQSNYVELAYGAEDGAVEGESMEIRRTRKIPIDDTKWLVYLDDSVARVRIIAVGNDRSIAESVESNGVIRKGNKAIWERMLSEQ